MRTIKEALEDGSLSLEDEIDYDDTPQAEEIALLKLEIERLNNIINELEKWLDEESEKTILSTGHLTCLMMCKNRLQELKGSDK